MKGRLLPKIELGNRMKRYKINEMTYLQQPYLFLSIVQINDFFHKFSCYQNDDNTKQIPIGDSFCLVEHLIIGYLP